MNIEIIKEELNKLNKKAIKKQEIPISAVIIYKNKIIAKSYNKVNKTNDIMKHAEINVIRKAAKKLKNWRLNQCILYVTLEPCNMCKEIIKKSRIQKTIFFIKQNNYITENEINLCYKEDKFFSKELKKYFKNVRNKNVSCETLKK